jgi:hypothetical protein
MASCKSPLPRQMLPLGRILQRRLSRFHSANSRARDKVLRLRADLVRRAGYHLRQVANCTGGDTAGCHIPLKTEELINSGSVVVALYQGGQMDRYRTPPPPPQRTATLDNIVDKYIWSNLENALCPRLHCVSALALGITRLGHKFTVAKQEAPAPLLATIRYPFKYSLEACSLSLRQTRLGE